MSVAIYPGSFDPITFGHLDIIGRAARVFDRLVVAILENPRKAALLGQDDRAEVIRRVIEEELPADVAQRVSIERFGGLTVEAARHHGAGFIVRGLRAVSDFESELQMAHFNRKLAPGIDTVFFMTSLEYAYLSSSLVKEIARFGGDVRAMVPPAVAERLEVAPPAEWSRGPAVG